MDKEHGQSVCRNIPKKVPNLTPGKEMQIEAIMWYHFLPINLAKIKIKTN